MTRKAIRLAHERIQQNHEVARRLVAASSPRKSAPPPDVGSVQDHLNAIHDNAVKAGASCVSNPPDDPVDPKAAAGARNSADDQERLDDIHDHSVAAGADCDPLDDEDPDPDLKHASPFAPPNPHEADINRLRAANEPRRMLTTLSAVSALNSEDWPTASSVCEIERIRDEKIAVR